MKLSERTSKIFSAAMVTTLATITCYLFTYAYLWGQLKVFGAPRCFLEIKTETLIFTALVGVILIGFIANFLLTMQGSQLITRSWGLQFASIFSFLFVFSYALIVISALEGIEANILYYLIITAMCLILSLLLSFVLRIGLAIARGIRKLSSRSQKPEPSTSTKEDMQHMLGKIALVFVILSLSVYALGFIAGQLIAVNKKSHLVIAGNPRRLVICDYRDGFVVAPLTDRDTILPIYSYVPFTEGTNVYHATLKRVAIHGDSYRVEKAIEILNE